MKMDKCTSINIKNVYMQNKTLKGVDKGEIVKQDEIMAKDECTYG